MTVVYYLWLREVKRYLRSRPQIIGSIAQPLLYLLVLGFGLGPVFEQSGQGSYLQFIAPGVVGMAILFTSIFSGIGLLWDRQFGFLKETLVAPVPRLQIMLGRTLGGATIASIQGTLILVVCMVAGFRPYSIAAIPLAFLFMMLVGLVFAGSRHGDRVDAEGHAGLSAHHELPGDADLLPLGSTLPAEQPAHGALARHARSTRFHTVWMACGAP